MIENIQTSDITALATLGDAVVLFIHNDIDRINKVLFQIQIKKDNNLYRIHDNDKK